MGCTANGLFVLGTDDTSAVQHSQAVSALQGGVAQPSSPLRAGCAASAAACLALLAGGVELTTSSPSACLLLDAAQSQLETGEEANVCQATPCCSFLARSLQTELGSSSSPQRAGNLLRPRSNVGQLVIGTSLSVVLKFKQCSCRIHRRTLVPVLVRNLSKQIHPALAFRMLRNLSIVTRSMFNRGKLPSRNVRRHWSNMTTIVHCKFELWRTFAPSLKNLWTNIPTQHRDWQSV